MRKFRIVLEVEVSETQEINQQVIESGFRNYQDFMADPENVESLGHEQTLLNLLLTNPEAYKKFITASLVSRLEGMSWFELKPLASIQRQDYETLADVVPDLPPTARNHFQVAIQEEWFSNATDILIDCFKYKFTSVQVEGDFTPPGAKED